jgi:thiosulfate dehydrogenase
MTMYGKVVPWQEMVNWCIENPQLGERLGPDSDRDDGHEGLRHVPAPRLPIQPGLASQQTAGGAGGIRYGLPA